ncbi:MAG: MCE family protein [Rhodospirillales bacterium]|nr:MCE family protein [Rhodospirillales bacterium]
MISRFVRGQLIAYSVISVVGILIMAFVYVDLPGQLGFGTYKITARFSEGGGLYPNDNVVYRGAEIGEVSAVRVTETAVDVEMTVDDDIAIPSDTQVEIRSMSAVGEQFVALTPQRAGPPFLAHNSAIPASRTQVEPGISRVLDGANKLLASVPRSSLDTTIDEAYLAMGRSGPNLQRLIDNLQKLVKTADQNYGPTQKLVQDLEPLLDTQRKTHRSVRSWTKDLAGFTDQVRSSDRDLRTLLDKGQPAAKQVNSLFQDLRPTLPILLGNLVSVGQVAVTYNPSIEQVLVLYPLAVTTLQTMTLPLAEEDSANLDFKANVNNPPPCTLGFTPPEQRRHPEQVNPIPTPDNFYCKLPKNDPTGVRGARNSPCPQAPGKRAATPAQCRGEGFRPEGTVGPFEPPKARAASSELYDPESGRYTTNDGQNYNYVIGGFSNPAPRSESMTWQTLLLEPIRR